VRGVVGCTGPLSQHHCCKQTGFLGLLACRLRAAESPPKCSPRLPCCRPQPPRHRCAACWPRATCWGSATCRRATTASWQVRGAGPVEAVLPVCRARGLGTRAAGESLLRSKACRA
jgi:hypothetical protein